MPTPPSSYKLTDEDKARMRAIRDRYGLASDTAAIRYALNEAYRSILREPEAAPARPRRAGAKA